MSCKWVLKAIRLTGHCVLSDGAKSGFLNIIKGVPLRLVLGTVLFTIYVNNISLMY